MNKLVLPSVLCVFFSLDAAGQEQSVDSLGFVPKVLEHVLEASTEDRQTTELTELLARYLEEPLDLEQASEDEIAGLPGMNRLIARNIIRWRGENRFTTIDDLLGVEGMDRERLDAIAPFVSVSPEGRHHRPVTLQVWGRSRMSTGIEPRFGYKSGDIPGSPIKMYNRVIATVGDMNISSGLPPISVEAGALAEKDQGESTLTDFVTGYVDLRAPGVGTRVLAGDYTFNSGLGLVFGSPRRVFKSSDVSTALRSVDGSLLPYRSAGENDYYRGLAIETSHSMFSVSLFFSDRPVHATVSENGSITSFYESGLFRTDQEQRHRNASAETVVGGRILVRPVRHAAIGISGHSTRYSHSLSIRGISPEMKQSFSNIGLDFSIMIDNVGLFGEAALDAERRMAGVFGILSRVSRELEVSGGYRSYPVNFASLHGYPLSENGDHPENERAFYGSVRLKANAWLHLSSYYDHFVFPGGDRSTGFSLSGNDFMGLADIRINRQATLAFQYRNRMKPMVVRSADTYDRIRQSIASRRQENYRVTFEYRTSPNVVLRTRAEYVAVAHSAGKDTEQGLLVYQDLRASVVTGLLVSIRVLGFQTDSYDSRLYEFEHDVRGVFTQPALSGHGVRWYCLLRYQPLSQVSVWGKFAQTIQDGAKTLHSGIEEISGDTESTLTLQVDVNI